MPLLSWLEGDLRELLMDVVGAPSARVGTYLDRGFVKDLLRGGMLKERNRAYLLYMLLVLELWLREQSQGEPETTPGQLAMCSTRILSEQAIMRNPFLPKYGPLAASTRYRFLQYVPRLRELGHECVVAPLLDDTYLATRFATGRADFTRVLRCYWRRCQALARAGDFDLLALNYEAFPYVPAWLEKLLLGHKVGYVYDYDDAVFHTYDLHRSWFVRKVLGGKVRTMIAGAKCVLAGNEYLADYARAVNPEVHILPTVIDLDRYALHPPRDPSRPFTIGWVGSPSTADYLKLIEPALATFCARHKARLVLMGFGTRCRLDVEGVEVLPWSEETEVDAIRQFDVGIMPVPETPWARGKCGFKLVQYMACGLPVVATPVGVNTDLVEEGVNGMLARSPEDWLRALETLRADDGLRQALGEAGRKKVERKYCLQVTAARFAALVEGAAGHTRLARTRPVPLVPSGIPHLYEGDA